MIRAAERAAPLALPLAVLALWQFASSAGAPEYLLPSPAKTAATVSAYILGGAAAGPYAGRFLSDLAASLFRVGCGFSLAALLGLPLGLASGRLPLLARILSPLVNGARAVPGISWLPLALAWLGIGFKTTVFLIALAAFFPIYLNAAAGAAGVAPVLVRAGAMLGLSQTGLFFHVVVPAAMPQLRAGLRIGLGLSFAYLVLGELTGVPDGLGAMIMDARLLGRVDLILAGILLMALVGWACDALLTTGLRATLRSARRS